MGQIYNYIYNCRCCQSEYTPPSGTRFCKRHLLQPGRSTLLLLCHCVITWTWNPKTDWTGLTMTKTVCHRLTDSQDRTNNQQLHKHSWLYTKTINVGKQTKPKSKLLLLSLWLCHRLDAGFCLCFDLGVARTWSQSQTLPWCLQFIHGFLRKSES